MAEIDVSNCMNILDINIDEYYDDIVDAIIEVFGDEYQHLIRKRAVNVVNLFYADVDGIDAYYYFLQTCKKKELSIKFLNKIGIDTTCYNVKSYGDEFDKDLKKIIYNYLGVCSFKKDSIDGISSFQIDDSNFLYQYAIMDQVEFLNFYRNTNDITIENYDEFKQTEEYKEVLNKINSYLDIYNDLCDEMDEYNKKNFYKQYVDKERKKEDDIRNRKFMKFDIFDGLDDFLSKKLKEHLHSITSLEKLKIIPALDLKSNIEYFSYEDDEILKKDEEFNSEKEDILWFRLRYFTQLGVLKKDIKIYDFNYDKILLFYNELISDENIAKLIPSYELVEMIARKKKKIFKESKEESIYLRRDFDKIINIVGKTDENKEFILSNLKQKYVCMTCGNDGTSMVPFIFYSVTSYCGGMMDYIYIHEFIHAIEASTNGLCGYTCGFEKLGYFIDNVNPYNNSNRKYERLNEVFVDIFAIEATNILHNKGIFIMEDKSFIGEIWNRNTDDLLKDMVMPLLEQYRNEIIMSRLLGRREILCDVIGYDNFDDLNDCINKVDNLINNGLKTKLQNKEFDNDLVVAYNSIMMSLEEVYCNINIVNENKKIKIKNYTKK